MRKRREAPPGTPPEPGSYQEALEGFARTDAHRKAQEAPQADPPSSPQTPPADAPAPPPEATAGQTNGAPGRRRRRVDPEVVETSEKLKQELEENARRDAANFAFERPNNKPVSPSELHPEIARIVETQIVEHPWDVYQELEAALRVGERRADHGSVNASLDEAETNARKAYRLWLTAKLESDRWRLDNEVVFGAMRLKATETLQQEKTMGLRNKQITDADVEAMVASLYPDEWRSQELKRKKVELMVKSMENLNECWLSRCRSLQAMLNKQR